MFHVKQITPKSCKQIVKHSIIFHNNCETILKFKILWNIKLISAIMSEKDRVSLYLTNERK